MSKPKKVKSYLNFPFTSFDTKPSSLVNDKEMLDIETSFIQHLHPFYTFGGFYKIILPKRAIIITLKEEYYIMTMRKKLDNQWCDYPSQVLIDGVAVSTFTDPNGFTKPIKISKGKHKLYSEFSIIIFKAQMNMDDIIKYIMGYIEKNKKYTEKKSNDNEEMVTKEIIPLRCPISFIKIEIPVKSKTCKHVHSYDLRSIIAQWMNDKWKCYCGSEFRISDIEFDKNFYEIIKESPEEAMYVEMEDGKVLRYLNEDKENITNKESIENNADAIDVDSFEMPEESEEMYDTSYNTNPFGKDDIEIIDLDE